MPLRSYSLSTNRLDARSASSTFGDPNNPPILFLHGIRLGREIWIPHANLLSPKYRVVTLDLPGHGALAHVPFTEENVSALMRDAVENVVGSPPLIVGYSLGGFVAMRFAAQSADRTRGLLLAGCTLDFEGWKWWPYGVSVRLTETLPDAWLSVLMHATLMLTLPRRWVEIVEGIPFDRDVFSQTSTMVRESNRAIEEIAGYSKPVLFVNGEFDFVFRSDERRFLHRLPQARLRIIRGVDHTAPIRRADEFAAIVDEFAGKVFAL